MKRFRWQRLMVTLAGAGLIAGGWCGGAARAALFQREGTYIYMAGEQVLGTETFSTVDLPGGHEIRSRTDLDLGTSLLAQSSILHVGPDGAFQSVTLAGELGGKPFGLHAEVTPADLLVRDTLTGAEEASPLAGSIQWITGNFMQHLIYVLSRYDRAVGGEQEILTQAGPLSIRPLGPATLRGPDAERAVEHFEVLFLEERLDAYLDGSGDADLFVIPDQGVRIFRQGLEGWTEGPIAAPNDLLAMPKRALELTP